jgi:hypothetical protein
MVVVVVIISGISQSGFQDKGDYRSHTHLERMRIGISTTSSPFSTPVSLTVLASGEDQLSPPRPEYVPMAWYYQFWYAGENLPLSLELFR